MSSHSHDRAARFYRLIGTGGTAANVSADSARGGAYAGMAEAADFVLRLASISILARLLIPEHFGLIAMVLSITTVAERFKDLGLSIATVQRKNLTHEQVSTLFWINGGLGLMTAFVVASLSIPISRFFNDDRLVGITLAIAASFAWSGLTIQHTALLRRTMRFGYLASIGIAASLFSIVIAIIMAMNDFGYWALVAREVARSAFLAVGIWIACPWVPDRPSRNTGAKEMIRFGGHVAIVQLATLFSMNFGSMVIGRVFGAGPVGLYRQGHALVLGPFEQITYPLWSVSEPALSRLQDDPEQYCRFYRKLLTLFSAITMPIAAFLAIHAEQIVLVFLGSAWLEATPIFEVMAVAAFLFPAASTISLVMITSGHSVRLLWLGLASAAALVCMCLIGSLWGPTGVAAAHVWATLLLLYPRLRFGLKGTPVRIMDFLASVARPAAAALLMAASVLVAEQHFRADFPVASLIAGSFMAPVLFLFFWTLLPGGKAELTMLVQGLFRALRTRRMAA